MSRHTLVNEPRHAALKAAKAKAELYAPRPTGGYFISGLCGATVGLLAIHIASLFYSLPQTAALGAGVVSTTSGTLAGLYIYRRARYRNRKAIAREMARNRHISESK